MRWDRVLTVVDCHAEGEVGKVVTGGVGEVPGETMFDKRLLHSKEAVEILKENFGDLVYKTLIRKTIRYAEAPVKGQSVLSYDPRGEAAELYRDLAREVLNGAKAREHA